MSKSLAGEVLGDAENIRMFSIKYIKGMEFDAVFFVDSDTLAMEHAALLQKYIYVALSRARYFLGNTVKNELPHDINILESCLDLGNWSR